MVTRRHAEIAGAGLGGLAAAIALAQRGWTVRVHERSDTLRMFGAGIWLWDNGLRSLAAFGVEETATKKAVPIETLMVSDPAGRTLMRRSFSENVRLALPPRADLYDALIARAEQLNVEFVTGSTAVAARADGELELENGDVCRADLVIAADGVFSRVRESLSLTRRVDYLEEGYIRLLIPRCSDDPATEVTEYWSGSRRLLYNPCTEEVDYVCLCCPVDDVAGRRVPVDKESWLESFPALSSYIERIDDAGRWDRGIIVTCRSWHHGRTAVVGDAAHGQPPNLGQGANLAFQNALALAEYLDRSPDIPSALSAWETKERPLTDHVQRWTNLYGRAASAWPDRFAKHRSRFLATATRIPWIDRQLNRAARHIPVGS